MQVHSNSLSLIHAKPNALSARSVPEHTSQAPTDSEPVDFCHLQGSESLSPERVQAIKATVNRAVEFFRENFGQVHQPVVIDLKPEKALRTGFNVSEQAVHFPSNQSGESEDLNSQDIMTHEVFHALTHQSYPEYCQGDKLTNPEFVRIHEGLADYFTHQLYPDAHFAEDRTASGEPLRSYRNDRRVSLSAGGHAQGNAITSYLLKHEIQPSQIRRFLESGDFSLDSLARVSQDLAEELAFDASLELTHQATNYPESHLNRYRLEEGKPLQLQFEANETLRALHPNLSIEWVRPTGESSSLLNFEESGDGEVSVSARQDGTEKVLALFKDGEALIGARPFYFSALDDPDPSPSAEYGISRRMGATGAAQSDYGQTPRQPSSSRGGRGPQRT